MSTITKNINEEGIDGDGGDIPQNDAIKTGENAFGGVDRNILMNNKDVTVSAHYVRITAGGKIKGYVDFALKFLKVS